MSAQIHDPVHALKFLLAGNAHATFVSKVTGTRFTYRIEKADPRPGDTRTPPHFVSVLTAPDHYDYLGCIFEERMYSHGSKSKIAGNAPAAVAFAWVWARLVDGRVPETADVFHEGRCGRCGRRLTVPESILNGLGPECSKRAS
jgi:hypothetical protein